MLEFRWIHQKQLYTNCEIDLSMVSAIASRFQSYVTYRYTDVRNDIYLIVVNPKGKHIFEHSYVKMVRSITVILLHCNIFVISMMRNFVPTWHEVGLLSLPSGLAVFILR